MARRLLEINARKREERLVEDEDQLSQLLAIQVSVLTTEYIKLRNEAKIIAKFLHINTE